jgi:predicted TIM-barrel fold metal-dependent hydrolase
MLIDSHSHIWSPDTRRFPLAAGFSVESLNPPSFTGAELMALARAEGVERVVLIQHSRFHRFDNATLLDATRRHPDTFRAVAMVDDRAPDPGAEMRRLLPLGVTGFRITPFIRKSDAGAWLDSPGMHAMWKTAAATRQAMCCLIDPHHLPGVEAMVERYPDTSVVIDHFARVGGAGQIHDSDVKALCALALHPYVCVKVSAFYALGAKRAPYLDLLVRRMVDAFGPQRLMWGSDSPYQLLDGHTYHDSIALVRDRLDFLTAEEREWLLRRTTERVFFFV